MNPVPEPMFFVDPPGYFEGREVWEQYRASLFALPSREQRQALILDATRVIVQIEKWERDPDMAALVKKSTPTKTGRGS